MQNMLDSAPSMCLVGSKRVKWAYLRFFKIMSPCKESSLIQIYEQRTGMIELIEKLTMGHG
jgi:hypothetical protein